jgi:cytochrome c553
MSRIKDLFKDDIQEAAVSLAERLPVTAPQLKKLDDDALKELDEAIKAVDQASDENEQIAAVQRRAGAIVKLLKVF